MQHMNFPQGGRTDATDALLMAMVEADGTATQPHVQSLCADAGNHGARPLASLADAAHYLCLLHGRFPGVVDHAATRSTDNAARKWLLQTCEAFADERAALSRVSVALGPVPSTSGQNNCDSAVLQQRHALEMLSQSDRRGCAMGAALTLVLDWTGVRHLLDRAAIRAGIEPRACTLPSVQDTLAVARAITVDEGSARAIQFGARQLLNQHRGLWALMQARASIRSVEG